MCSGYVTMVCETDHFRMNTRTDKNEQKHRGLKRLDNFRVGFKHVHRSDVLCFTLRIRNVAVIFLFKILL